MWIHFRKIANFGAISKIEKYIKNQKSETFLNIQIYNFCRLSKNQYENFTNFVPPVKFPYWFSFIFYGFGIFYIYITKIFPRECFSERGFNFFFFIQILFSNIRPYHHIGNKFFHIDNW